MSIYSEISQQYKKLFERQQARLFMMSSAASAFAAGFERYLSIPDITWTDSKGDQQRYVRLGTGDEHNFNEVGFLKLSSLNGVVHFSVALTVEQDAHSGYRQVVVFQFTVSISGDNFEITAKDLPLTLSVNIDDKDKQRFDPIYAALVERLMNMFDPEKI
ncbi:hypothetical protein KKQ10_24685 [Pseudomonas sp. MG-9]|uniref:hypothetical protein n=1 Tax=Pseudomonas sp. MG-9 TaxID=2839032 RepID=UPI001C003FE4|nr:hypothetical protein [Pseudomonas sp. MG-9]MBT9268077.1 hypothetical protein [Pseudomonas sp. MG-9]